MPKLLLLFLTIGFVQSAIAQPLQFKNITVDDGLNVNSINHFIKDRDGFMWFATSDGICRYDGKNFKQYHADKTKPNSLHGYIYLALHEDKYGNIWAESDNGIEVIDKKSSKINRVIIDNAKINNHDFGTYFFALNNGNEIARVSQDLKLEIFDVERQKLKHRLKIPLKNYLNSLPTFKVSFNSFKIGDNIYFINNNSTEILKFDNKTKQFISTKITTQYKIELQSNTQLINVNIIRFLGKTNNMLCIYEYQVDQNRLTRIKEVAKLKSSIYSNYYYDSTYKKTYIAIGGDGLYELDAQDKIVNTYRHDPQNPNSLIGNSYFGKIVNIENQLWVINNPDGISYANLGQSQFTNYSSKIGLPDMSKGIFTDAKGNIYNMPVGHGTKYYNKQTGQNITATLPARTLATFEKLEYFAFNSTINLNKDKLLLYTPYHLMVYNHKTQELINYTSDFRRQINNLTNQLFAYAYKITESSIYLINAKTLYEINLLPNGKFNIINKTELPQVLTSIELLTNGKKVLGSSNGFYLETKEGKYEPILSAKNYLVKSLTRATDGKIYAACIGAFIILNKDGTVLKEYTTLNGLTSGFCYMALEDKQNNIWLSNNAGLTKYNPRDSSFTYFTKSDGLQGNEFNSGAAYKDENGKLYFGGVNGITAFNPEDIAKNKNINNTKLVALAINDQWLNRDSAVWQIENITLPYHQNTLTFEFAPFVYNNPDAITYYYKLEGFDKNWIETGNTTFVRYTGLKNGNYSFLVKQKMNGIETDAKKLIGVKIKPAYYQTWWFITLVFLASSFMIWQLAAAINKRKYQQKLAAYKLQQEIEQERQRISRDLHDNMGAYTSALLANVDQIKKTTGESEITAKMQSNASNILSNLRETIWILNNKEVSTNDLIEAFKNYAFSILKNYEHISFNAEENIVLNNKLTATTYINTLKALQEILQNSVKHSKCSLINFSISDTPNLQLTLSDNGIGFDKDNIIAGNGLENIEYRLNEIGVMFFCESGNNGTKYQLIQKNSRLIVP